MNITSTATYNTILSTCRDVGTKVPTALAREAAALDKPTDLAEQIQSGPHALADAVVSALGAGRSLEDDEAVRRLLVRRSLSVLGIGGLLESRAEAARAALLVKHAGAIVEAWRKPVTEADRRLTRAREEIGTVSLTDANSVTRMSPHQMEVWGEAGVAHAWLGKILNAWTMLMNTTGLVQLTGSDRTLILADMTGREHLEHLRSRDPAATVVHQAGVPLDLATPEVARARMKALAHTREQVRLEDEARRQRKAAPMGMGELVG